MPYLVPNPPAGYYACTTRRHGHPVNLDNRIKLRHPACFLEVVRQRSFTKAADAVAVSQPATSKTFKELEEILDARLFEWSKVGTEPAEAGVTFLRYVGPRVQILRDGVNTLRDHEVQVETVRVGMLSTVESLVVSEVIRRLHRRHGALVTGVAARPSAYLPAQPKVGELDLVVEWMTGSPDIQGLIFEHLYSESMMLVVHLGYPLLVVPLGDPQRLAEFPLVLLLAGTTTRHHADSPFVQCGIPLAGQRPETLSPTLSRSYALRSEAIWVAPCDAMRLDVGGGELAELDLGIRELGGSAGSCHNAALPLPLGA